MSLFRRDTGPPEIDRSAPQIPTAGPAGSHVAPGARIEGMIGGNADLAVDGEIEGQIAIEGRATIGPNGRITGPVRARSVRLAGRILGDVAATERVEVVATGHLEGNISAPRVVIAEGAYFKGRVEMAAGPRAGARERKS